MPYKWTSIYRVRGVYSNLLPLYWSWANTDGGRENKKDLLLTLRKFDSVVKTAFSKRFVSNQIDQWNSTVFIILPYKCTLHTTPAWKCKKSYRTKSSNHLSRKKAFFTRCVKHKVLSKGQAFFVPHIYKFELDSVKLRPASTYTNVQNIADPINRSIE